jgi:hypothetical protein
MTNPEPAKEVDGCDESIAAALETPVEQVNIDEVDVSSPNQTRDKTFPSRRRVVTLAVSVLVCKICLRDCLT